MIQHETLRARFENPPTVSQLMPHFGPAEEEEDSPDNSSVIAGKLMALTVSAGGVVKTRP